LTGERANIFSCMFEVFRMQPNEYKIISEGRVCRGESNE